MNRFFEDGFWVACEKGLNYNLGYFDTPNIGSIYRDGTVAIYGFTLSPDNLRTIATLTERIREHHAKENTNA